MSNKIILASASPRRFDLLINAGFDVTVKPAHIVEEQLSSETPQQMVLRLAIQKARAVAAEYPNQVVLAGDTTVIHADENLGKPQDAADALAMLKKLQGNWHTVFSACAVMLGGHNKIASQVSATEVKFVNLSDHELQAYIATGEPLDKAGSYGIQEIGAQFIEQIKGSYTNVVGLDLVQAVKLLKEFGVSALVK